MTKSRLTFLLLLALAAGCLSAPGRSEIEGQATSTPIQSSPTPVCTSPGTTHMLKVDTDIEIGLYLPPCYAPAGNFLYPALYLLPGAGGSPWDWLDAGVAGTADRSILSAEVPPFLIVTTDDTYEDITLDGILGTVIPYIESRYRTDPERRYRAVAGGSLGGASAYMLAFQHPDLFASAGVFGNGLIFGQEEMTRAWLKAIPADLKPRVFLNSGEGDTFMLQQAKLLIPLLDEAGISHAEIFTPGGHAYSYWLSNFPAYFRWLAQDWR